MYGPGWIPGKDHGLIQEAGKQHKRMGARGIFQGTVIADPLPAPVKDLVFEGFEYGRVPVKRGGKRCGFSDIRVDEKGTGQAGYNLYF
jgi:hypothetical protein